MASTLVLWLVFPALMKTETLVYGANPAPDIVECTDASTPCVIHCTTKNYCNSREFHCHRTAPQSCSFHVEEDSAGYSHFYTHQAPIVYINASGWHTLYNSVIYAHEAMQSKLYILCTGGGYTLRKLTIYAPVGEGSLLDLTCFGGRGCESMRIYDDWTTEVRIEALEMLNSQIRNMFDDSPLNISRNDTIYTGLNSEYRAPVYLNCLDLAASFENVQYFGNNHGDWSLNGSSTRCFASTYIEATADIPPYNRSGYDINVTANAGRDIFSRFTLNATQFGANIYVQVTGDNSGVSNAEIYAQEANSVEVHCTEGGSGFCNGLMVECPLNNECKIQCDDDVNTDCSNMEIYTNDLLCDGIQCDGIQCNFNGTKVFCGFAQSETFCEVQYDLFCQNNGARDCTNEAARASCTDEPTVSPTTDDPSAAPSHPSLSPSELTTEPSASPTAAPHEMIVTNYTILIEIQSCAKDECSVNEREIEEFLSALYEIRILSTAVLEKQTVFVISITTQKYNQISGDAISDALEAELKRGDVTVTVKEISDSNDDDDDNDTFNIRITIGIIVACMLLIAIVSFCIYYFCVNRRRKEEVMKQQEMMQIQMKQNAVDVFNNNSKLDEEEQSGVVPGAKSEDVGSDSDVNVLAEGVRQKRRESELTYVNNVDTVQQTVGNTQKTEGNTKETRGHV